MADDTKQKQWALILGASSGFGAATARELAKKERGGVPHLVRFSIAAKRRFFTGQLQNVRKPRDPTGRESADRPGGNGIHADIF